jgi:hypothetical protein
MPRPDEKSLVNREPTALRPIADFQLAPPATWASIPIAPQEGSWPLDVGRRLCDEETKAKRLAIGLAAAHTDLLGREAHAMAAVWVPDRAAGQLEGVLTVDWVLPDPGAALTRDYYRQLLAKAKRAGVEILAQRLDEVDLPAGPALRVRERTSRSTGRLFSRRQAVFECVLYTVLPPEISDALLLTFSTTALDLGDALAADADVSLPTLNVLLGDPDAPT